MRNRLSLTSVFLIVAWVPCVMPACRCSQDPEVLSHAEACEEIGFSLSNRTVTCGESAERGNEAFEEFTSSFACKDVEPAADAGPDAGGSFVSIMDCAEAMLTVSCDLLVGPTGSMRGALESSAACIGALQPWDGGNLQPVCPNEGQTRCGDECVYLKNDSNHCGTCDNTCPGDQTLNFAAECNEGVCAIRCLNSRLDCDGNPANGCEVDWMEDVNNCLGCGKVCPAATQPGQEARCHGAVCVTPCDSTHLDCDGQSENGCEVTVDIHNCYVCGADCTSGGINIGECRADIRACAGGSSCPAGTLNCDLVQDCEAVWTVEHCGTCNNKCPAQANANAVCVNGGCALECLTGFLDCNSDPTDGCEVQSTACP